MVAVLQFPLPPLLPPFLSPIHPSISPSLCIYLPDIFRGEREMYMLPTDVLTMVLF